MLLSGRWDIVELAFFATPHYHNTNRCSVETGMIYSRPVAAWGKQETEQTAADCLYFDVTSYIIVLQCRKFKVSSSCISMNVH